MVFDFALILFIATLFTGAIWLLDVLVLRSRRATVDGSASEPVLVEYCRTFFPVILVVLLVRSFLFEPFRIPSDSMMPTLLDGDFIFVNKYAYGIRLPVINKKIIDIDEPGRGDVVVFRLPSDPSTNYIKRVVGLPGDRIGYSANRLYINGEPMPVNVRGAYREHGYQGNLVVESIDGKEHKVLLLPQRYSREGEWQVPDGHFFVMGDNRDNSRDSRFPGVGAIPESQLVGRAVRIWMNWNFPEDGPLWNRVGEKIE
ncbi:MAG: signal peptidase I [Gammaproteobacteria bacterium]|nr:signal peptidase I [Gammaproteobacteria bacterium]